MEKKLKNKLLLCLVTTMSLSSLSEARQYMHHHRNGEVAFLGDEKNSLQYKKTQIVPHDKVDFEMASPAGCLNLPRHIENVQKFLLSKEGKSQEKILADERQFYRIVLNLARAGGEQVYGSYDPKLEYLLSHKVAALKLITEARTSNVELETRAEAAFMLAQIMEKVGGLASNMKIFNLYHIASIYAPNTKFGAQAAVAQVNMVEGNRVNIDEIPVASISRLLNLMQNNVQRPLWQQAGFAPEFQISKDAKKKALRIRTKATVEHHKLLRQNAYQNLSVLVY